MTGVGIFVPSRQNLTLTKVERYMKKTVVLLLCAILANILFAAEARREVLMQSCKFWDGEEISSLKIDKPELSLVKAIIPPNKELKLHKHDIINVCYIAKGKMKIETPDGKVLMLNKGDSMVELVGKYHRGVNIGDEDVEMIIFYIGEKGSELTIQKEQ